MLSKYAQEDGFNTVDWRKVSKEREDPCYGCWRSDCINCEHYTGRKLSLDRGY